jgi:glycosyltransferase involved in cell wall biosynthesis
MDRNVPPRVAYWLSSFDPDMEAVAAEVACLRRLNPGSVAWGIGQRNWLRLSWKKGFGFHPRLHLLFRAAAAFGQHGFDINHLFGSVGDWFHLKTVRKRPIVMTIALDGECCDNRLLQKVDQFVVEWPWEQERLRNLGIDQSLVRLVYPPVDLERFQPTPSPNGPFTVLFASSPDRAEHLEARGVDVILKTALMRPQMRFRLIWRPWGDGLPRIQEWIRASEARNVELVLGRFSDMSAHYAEAHATIAPFAGRAHCKPVPNTLVESLACGRPVVATDSVGIANLISETGAGERCSATAEALADSLDRLEADWSAYSFNARRLAEQQFDQQLFLSSYAQVYQRLS